MNVDCSLADGSVGILVLFATAASAIRLRGTSAEGDHIARVVYWLNALGRRAVPDPIIAYSIDWNVAQFLLGGYASHRGIGLGRPLDGWLSYSVASCVRPHALNDTARRSRLGQSLGSGPNIHLTTWIDAMLYFAKLPRSCIVV